MKKYLLGYIEETKVYQRLIHILKSIEISRHEGLTLYEVIKVFIEKLRKDDVIERANGVAFNFALSIFPAIIFLFTLIPYIHDLIPDVSQESILKFIQNMMPQSMFETVESTVTDIIGNTRGGLLTFGAVFSLYLATNGMLSLMKAFNACYKTLEKRGIFKMRMVATALTFMLAFVLILAVLLLVVGNFVIDYVEAIAWLDIEDYVFYILFIVRFLVIFIVFFLAISFIYYFGPAVHYNWRFFSIGSLIATILCIAVSYGFSFYITNFATYNKLYGSLGALIALMVWQEILSIVLLVGYEINASIHQAYRTREVDEPIKNYD